MKHTLAFALLGSCLAVWTSCSSVTSTNYNVTSYSDSDLTAVTNVTRTGQIPADLRTLEVENSSGAIRITGATNGPMEWSWHLKVRAIDEVQAQKAAAGAKCTAQPEGDRLKLVVSLPESRARHLFESDLEIRVPKSVAVRAENRFGRIEIADLESQVEAADQNGSVVVRNIGGAVRARTSFATLTVTQTGRALLKNQNGRIEATDIRGALDAETSFAPLVARNIGDTVKLRNQNGGIDVSTVEGSADVATSFALLTAKGIAGRAVFVNQNGKIVASDIAGAVEATTSFAPIEVAGGGPQFVCRNQNGAIRLHATSASLMSIDAKTSFTPLEVRLPASLKPAIQAHTSFADVESDFPVLMKPRGQDPFAEVGPGTPRVKLENQNGKIRISKD